jgi:transposase
MSHGIKWGIKLRTNVAPAKKPLTDPDRKWKTQWHAGNFDALRAELKDYLDNLEFHAEHPLTDEPLRIDALVVKKIGRVKIKKNFAKNFRTLRAYPYFKLFRHYYNSSFSSVVHIALLPSALMQTLNSYVGLKGGDCMTQKNSWEITDEFWEAVKDLIPKRERDPNRICRRGPGAGRRPKPPRLVPAAIFFVLRTGIQWKALPDKFGSPSSVHKYFQEWCKIGVFEKMWALGLERYDELRGIQWEWQSVDGATIKAPLAWKGEAAGPNPTDRGKMEQSGASWWMARAFRRDPQSTARTATTRRCLRRRSAP